MPPHKLPDYQPMLDAYHRAFAHPLQNMLDTLPLKTSDVVLDVACGDGSFSEWIAARLDGQGRLVAIDLLDACLQATQKSLRKLHFKPATALCRSNVEQLPFAEQTFDFVWCAQSFYSFPDQRQALREMCRVLKPGGCLAVLENDEFHHVLLPWPVELELAIRGAELAGLARWTDDPQKFFVGRGLMGLLSEPGLTSIVERTFATSRQTPFSDADRDFLRTYLENLAERVDGYLPVGQDREFRQLIDPNSPHSLLQHPNLSFTCLDHVAWGIRPSKG